MKEKFDGKAFQRRQEAVLLALRASGYAPDQVAAMTLGQLDLLVFADPEAARQLPRYRAHPDRARPRAGAPATTPSPISTAGR